MGFTQTVTRFLEGRAIPAACGVAINVMDKIGAAQELAQPARTAADAAANLGAALAVRAGLPSRVLLGAKDLLGIERAHIVPDCAQNPNGLRMFLSSHPDIRYVSFRGVDMAGNTTDELIPVERVFDDPNMLKDGTETDGSSVVLPGIASLTNAKVAIAPNLSMRPVIDWNVETGIGTLQIFCDLVHNGKKVGALDVATRTEEHLDAKMKKLLKAHPDLLPQGVRPAQVKKVRSTVATEMEFWVEAPLGDEEKAAASTTQKLQQNYWQRMDERVEGVMQEVLTLLEQEGLVPEKAHTEVGGLKTLKRKALKDRQAGDEKVCAQYEIDWKWDLLSATVVKQIRAKEIIERVFKRHGLNVNFDAKPFLGLAGNGMHTHIGIQAELDNGKVINLFHEAGQSPLSRIGWSALMGIIDNWYQINPFITATADGLNRLKPGFEAPVSPCASIVIGEDGSKQITRRRDVAVGVLIDKDHPKATRFEVRAPNPHTNLALSASAMVMAMLEGIERYAALDTRAIEDCYKQGTPDGRKYATEKHVFDDLTEDERTELFGKAPATPFEALHPLENTEKLEFLTRGGAFTPQVIASYRAGMLEKWKLELSGDFIPEEHKRILEMERAMAAVLASSSAGVARLYALRRTSALKLMDKLARDHLAKEQKTDGQMMMLVGRKKVPVDRSLVVAEDGILVARVALLSQLEKACSDDNFERMHALFLKAGKVIAELEHLYRTLRNPSRA